MTVSVYTLRIRAEADETDSEVRIVAASLTEAVARAEMRFGAGRIVSIEQAESDAADTDATDAEPQSVSQDAQEIPPPEAPIVADDFIVARAPEALPEPVDTGIAEPAGVANGPVAFAIDTPMHVASPSAPRSGSMPWEGRWRPSVLLWGGAVAGLVAFVLWMSLGDAPHDRFVIADAGAIPAQQGLPLEGRAPAGGVLQATGVSLRPGRADAGIVDLAGQVVLNGPEDGTGNAGEIEYGADEAVDDGTVRAIGTLVGEIFSSFPDDPPPPRAPQPRQNSMDGGPTGESWPADRGAAMPRASMPEPALLRRWYIEVQRADRVTETLSVNAIDAEHALSIVYDRPDHPVVVRGPSTELSW